MKNKVFILLCFLSLQFFGQTVIGVDTILKSGPINKRINIVIISEGFTTSQMSQFITNAKSLSTYLFNQAPYKAYKKYFNVFAIKCPSQQSGVSHPGTATDVTEPIIPVATVQTNFNTTFDNNFTHRAIVSNNSSAIYGVLATSFPAYDQIVILANSPEYGGTGGPYAVMSINSSAPETLVHEMGHSFAGLADEYWAGNIFANEKPNMTAATFTNAVKWNPWLGTNSVGIYPYDTISPADHWFRPHQNCKMRFLGVPYCSVCQQTVIEKIHSISNPIDEYLPDNSGLLTPTSSEWFKAVLVKPSPNTLRTTWELNSNVIAANKDSVLVNNNWFLEGDNSVVLTVIDTTKFSRDTAHVNLHTYSVLWNINYSSVGIKEIKAKMEFSVFPNPATDLINLNYTLLEESRIGISIIDMNGRTVISEKAVKSAAGEYKREIDVSKLNEGNYILALRINNQTINNKIIIVK